MKAYKIEFISHFFKLDNINNIVKYNIINSFFNNFNYYSNSYIFLFYFLIVKYYQD